MPRPVKPASSRPKEHDPIEAFIRQQNEKHLKHKLENPTSDPNSWFLQTYQLNKEKGAWEPRPRDPATPTLAQQAVQKKKDERDRNRRSAPEANLPGPRAHRPIAQPLTGIPRYAGEMPHQRPVPEEDQAELDEISNFVEEQEAQRKVEASGLRNWQPNPLVLPLLSHLGRALAIRSSDGPFEGPYQTGGSEGRREEGYQKPQSQAPAAPARRVTFGNDRHWLVANALALTGREATTVMVDGVEVGAADATQRKGKSTAPATSTFDRRARAKSPPPSRCPRRAWANDPMEADHNGTEVAAPDSIEAAPHDDNDVADDGPVAHPGVLDTALGCFMSCFVLFSTHSWRD